MATFVTASPLHSSGFHFRRNLREIGLYRGDLDRSTSHNRVLFIVGHFNCVRSGYKNENCVKPKACFRQVVAL